MLKNLLMQDNRLFELAKLARLRPKFIPEKGYPILALLFGLLAPLVAALCVVPLVLINLAQTGAVSQMPALTADPNLNMALILIVSFGPIYFLIWGWLWLFEQRHLWTIGLEGPGWLQKYLRGVLVGLILFSASVGVMALLGYTAFETNSPQPSRWPHIGGVLIIFLGWMVQGAAEEVLARGFLLPVIGIRWGAVAGIGLSSLLFALLHSLNPNLSVIAVFNLFLFGVFASLYALWDKSLWGVFAIHSIWNWAQGNVYGFEVSGQGLPTATLLNLQETGPDWFTGGSFGPEGGLVVTVVLMVGSVLVWWMQQHKRNTE
jgi:hypothetical protein